LRTVFDYHIGIGRIGDLAVRLRLHFHLKVRPRIEFQGHRSAALSRLTGEQPDVLASASIRDA
jgi:hypothetical protein